MTSAFALWMRALAIGSGLFGLLRLLLVKTVKTCRFCWTMLDPKSLAIVDSSGRGMEAQTMQP
jgi:hypothetical protein